MRDQAEEAHNAGGGVRHPRERPPASQRDGIHGPGIAALMAEAGLARRHRTACRAPVRET